MSQNKGATVYGLDFTSAPGKRKPITCAVCVFKDGVLRLEHQQPLISFAEFEQFLRTEGSWIAGIDAPFGQPRELVENLNWPQAWQDYVRHIKSLGKAGFIDAVRRYQASRPKGKKEHKRRVDVLSKSQSPMKFWGVPVGRMFFELTPRLVATSLNLPLLRPTDDPRTVVEAYPALIGRPWSYKSDMRKKQTRCQLEARRKIVEKLLSEQFRETYVGVQLSKGQQDELVSDPKADVLDAFLCAVQAAWSYTQRESNCGIPDSADALEGWITDPTLLKL